MTSYGPRIKPRDDLFWFKKQKFLLWLIHFVLFQNAFELAFFWFWWQFGYDSCFIKNHLLVYCRLVLGFRFAGQFLCSYSTLHVYALVTQGFDLRILTKEEDCRGRPVLGRVVGGEQTRACQLWAGTRKGDVLGR